MHMASTPRHAPWSSIIRSSAKYSTAQMQENYVIGLQTIHDLFAAEQNTLP